MRKIWMALAVAALVAIPAAASDRTDAIATVNKFVKDFNVGDMKAAAADCSDVIHIIDEFPPYEWHGADSCSRWSSDLDAINQKNGVTNPKVTLGVPRHVEIMGGTAYVVLPANYLFDQKGKPVRETGSVLTCVLKKGQSGWRIVAWSWSKH